MVKAVTLLRILALGAAAVDASLCSATATVTETLTRYAPPCPPPAAVDCASVPPSCRLSSSTTTPTAVTTQAASRSAGSASKSRLGPRETGEDGLPSKSATGYPAPPPPLSSRRTGSTSRSVAGTGEASSNPASGTLCAGAPECLVTGTTSLTSPGKSSVSSATSYSSLHTSARTPSHEFTSPGQSSVSLATSYSSLQISARTPSHELTSPGKSSVPLATSSSSPQTSARTPSQNSSRHHSSSQATSSFPISTSPPHVHGSYSGHVSTATSPATTPSAAQTKPAASASPTTSKRPGGGTKALADEASTSRTPYSLAPPSPDSDSLAAEATPGPRGDSASVPGRPTTAPGGYAFSALTPGPRPSGFQDYPVTSGSLAGSLTVSQATTLLTTRKSFDERSIDSSAAPTTKATAPYRLPDYGISQSDLSCLGGASSYCTH